MFFPLGWAFPLALMLGAVPFFIEFPVGIPLGVPIVAPPSALIGGAVVWGGGEVEPPPQLKWPPPESTQLRPFGQYSPCPQQMLPAGAQVPSLQFTG